MEEIRTLSWLPLVVVCHLYGLLCYTSSVSSLETATLPATLAFHPDISHAGSLHLPCHSELNITVDIDGGETVTLHLYRTQHIDYHKIPVYTAGQSGQLSTNRIYDARKPCFYKDLDKHSAISLLPNDNGRFIVRGVFHTLHYSYKCNGKTETEKGSNMHYVHRKVNRESHKQGEHFLRRDKRQARNKKIYTVELFLIADLSLYQRWYNFSMKETPSEKDKEAVDNIKYYFTHLVNELDLRYESIIHNDFTISVILSGILIAKTGTDLRWEESLKESAPTGSKSTHSLRGSDALAAFGRWVIQRTHLLGYDHIMLVTGYDIYEVAGPLGVKAYSKIGNAYMRGACHRELRVSIIEDRGHFESVLTAAHELGHSLGASHDGEDNTCRSEDQFIMASTVESRTDDNIFRFSPCSINAFSGFISSLNRLRSNCLIRGKTYYNKTAIDTYLQEWPGVKFSPSEQCHIYYGKDSFYCGGQGDVKKLCQSLVCHNPKDAKCYILSTPAYEGTPCGNKEICNKNECIYHKNAPEKSENCTYGDTEDSILLGDKRYYCQELIDQYPSLCYDEDITDLCCASCAKIYRTDRPTCPYGDRQLGCGSFWSRGTCKMAAETCCGTCEQYMTGIPGCEFGDEASWCAVSMTNVQCYLPEGKHCCETCHKYKTNITGCEFGDRIPGCSKARCGSSIYNEHNCCKTCAIATTSTTTTTTTRATTTTYRPPPAPTSRPEVTDYNGQRPESSTEKHSTSTQKERQSPFDPSSSACTLVSSVNILITVFLVHLLSLV